jgi:hypothetical protein
MTTTGVIGQRFCTDANESGGEPATFASRETPAPKGTEADDGFDLPEDQFGGEASEIEREFQRRLADIRRLPHRDRAGARRMAINWRSETLKALAEKRRAAQRAQISDRQRIRHSNGEHRASSRGHDPRGRLEDWSAPPFIM